MHLKLTGLIGACLLTVGGCFGGGDSVDDSSNPPPPPPPPPTTSALGGLWSGAVFWDPKDGFPGGALNARALITETGEFRIVLSEDVEQYFGGQNEQIFGTFDIDGRDISTTGDAIWTKPLNETSDDWAAFGMAGDFRAGDSISGVFQANWASWMHFEERVGTLSMNYHSIYERESSLVILQGTYTTTTESLVVDDQGVIFHQSSATGCTGNGTTEIINSEYNMYRVTIDVAGCTGDAEVRNGLTFTGLANIGENNDLTGGFLNSTFEMAASASIGLPFGQGYVPWTLRAHKN